MKTTVRFLPVFSFLFALAVVAWPVARGALQADEIVTVPSPEPTPAHPVPLPGDVTITPAPEPPVVLPGLSGADREALIAELLVDAADDSEWLWIEHYEVGYPKANPDAYLSPFNFERMKAIRRQALRDAAYRLEHYTPAAP